MKTLFNYIVCATALSVGVILSLGGGFSCVCSLVWWFALYLHGKRFPNVWRAFYVANLKILARFDCLLFACAHVCNIN